MIGAAVMFIVLLWKWGLWLYRLPLADKKRILFGLPTRRTFSAIGEVVGESLLHRRIFRVNPLLCAVAGACLLQVLFDGAPA